MSKSPIFQRIMADIVSTALKQFPIVSITGPRQSGKTTLAHLAAGSYQYLNMEIEEHKYFATSDPNGFLKKYNYKVILDEVQAVPSLFIYLQQHTDKLNKNGAYILSGSQNFLLIEKISQTLAGRVAVFSLLPFSLHEIFPYLKKGQKNWMPICYRGFYPRVFKEKKMMPQIFYNSYCKTYIEKDVRQILNVHNARAFMQFLKLCATRVGTIFNSQDLANKVGVDNKTISRWVTVLESSYILYFLPAYHNNFEKRIVKKPKIYFTDTGLLCFLLGINNYTQIEGHKFQGNLFENFVIIDRLKNYYNKGLAANFYFWQDSNGREVDLIIDDANQLKIYEIKSSSTIKNEFFKNINMFESLAQKSELQVKKHLIYSGPESHTMNGIKICSWETLGE